VPYCSFLGLFSAIYIRIQFSSLNPLPKICRWFHSTRCQQSVPEDT